MIPITNAMEEMSSITMNPPATAPATSPLLLEAAEIVNSYHAIGILHVFFQTAN